MKPKSHKPELFVHLMTAIILITKGIDKLTHHYILIGTAIFIFGIAVFIITVFGKRINVSHISAKLTCYLIESVALYLTAYVFFDEGKKYLPWFTLLSATLYVAAYIINYKKSSQLH